MLSMYLRCIACITHRVGKSNAPLHTAHNHDHQAQSSHNAPKCITPTMLPPQAIDLSHPSANSRQTSAKPVHDALQYLTSLYPTASAAHESNAHMLNIKAHAF